MPADPPLIDRTLKSPRKCRAIASKKGNLIIPPNLTHTSHSTRDRNQPNLTKIKSYRIYKRLWRS